MSGFERKITETLYMNSRMSLDFFMFLPEGYFTAPDRCSIELKNNPVLYIRYKKPKNYAAAYDYTKASYKVSPKTFYHLLKFFNSIIHWFYDDKYKDLFMYNQDGKLIFNADYKKLNVSMPVNDYSQQYMQAIPSVVELGGKISEGVIIFINKTEYQIPLKYDEVESIFGILKTFRFSEEVTKTLTIYEYLTRENKITSYEDRQKTPFD